MSVARRGRGSIRWCAGMSLVCVWVGVWVCVCVRARACVCVRECACVLACVRACVYVCIGLWPFAHACEPARVPDGISCQSLMQITCL